MEHIGVYDLQPIFEHVAPSITPGAPTVDCPIATAVYWALRIDGEIGNGGVAQLIWNLHDAYEPKVLVNQLMGIGAAAAADVVQRGFAYVSETPARKQRFFARGPFGPAKPLVQLTDRYDDLTPSVSSLLATFVLTNWDRPSFQAALSAAGVGDIRQSEVSEELLWTAIDNADGDALLGFVEAGLDPNHRIERGHSLIKQVLRRSDKVAARVTIIQRVVAAGADIEAVDRSGDTALTGSVFYGGNPVSVQCLIDLGADIEHIGSRGRTTVFGATKNPDTLQVLLDADARLDHVAGNGQSVLGFALEEWGDCVTDTDHAFRNERLPPRRRSVDVLIERGAPLSSQVVTVPRPPDRHTELCSSVVDVDVLRRVVELPTFESTPDATGEGGAWTALHEAARQGDAEAIGVLVAAGAVVRSASAASDLGRGVFAGATAVDVAADEATAALLIAHGSTPGVRQSHDVHLTARGEGLAELIELFSRIGGLDPTAAAQAVAALPPEVGKTVDWDENDDLILYSTVLLASVDSAAEAAAIAADVIASGAEVVVL